ncbi:MAG TPA: hypothetical protein VNQ79_20890 [Blastocatellia bacterium]|nr:hypothetical protein [Blastocatellia bacterium]
MKILRRLTLSALCLLALSVPALAQTAQVAGEWDLTITSPQGSNTTRAVLKQEGDKITGVFRGQRGELPLQGSVTGKEIKVTFTVRFQDNDLPITLKGNVDGDTMKGTADFGGFAEGEWSGKRAEAAAAAGGAAASSEKIDVTGTWAVEVETSAGSGSPTFTFKQDGENLTGQYKGQLGEAPVKGTVKGNEITFSIEVSQGTVVYKGKIENGLMKGTVSLGDLGSGTWTGKRKQ